MNESPPILVLVRDLIFSSKIGATARAANAPIKIVRDAGNLLGETGRLLIVDLNQEGAIAAAGAWRRASGMPVIGFVSHIDAATIGEARAAGIDQIIARSQFVNVLPELLGPAPFKQ